MPAAQVTGLFRPERSDPAVGGSADRQSHTLPLMAAHFYSKTVLNSECKCVQYYIG